LVSQFSDESASALRSTGIGAGRPAGMPLTIASWRGSLASSFLCLKGSSSSGRSTMVKDGGNGSA
jgi:hypothetical protein